LPPAYLLVLAEIICDRRFGGTYRLHLQGRRNNFSFPPVYLLVLAEIISSTLKLEAICSSETSVATQQTTRRHIPEDDILHNHRCANLKSYVIQSRPKGMENEAGVSSNSGYYKNEEEDLISCKIFL
jgi:hypothetical protein